MLYKVIRNDITKMTVDAIVLPANPKLAEGPGASAAIFEKAGRKQLTRACKQLLEKSKRNHWNIHAGTAVATLAYGHNADYIVHAIVPKWIDGNHDEYGLLSATYLSSLRLSDAMNCKSIAFPLLASGNNGYETDLAFQIAIESIEQYQPSNTLEIVYLVIYGFRAMEVARRHGFAVGEYIDQKSVFLKEEEMRHPLVKLFEKGQDFADGVVDKGLEQAMEFLGNEDNQYEVIEKGKDIAVNVLGQVAKAVVEASKKQDGHKDHERNHKRGTKRKSSS